MPLGPPKMSGTPLILKLLTRLSAFAIIVPLKTLRS